MHLEKNVFKSTIGVLLDINTKTNDGLKSRMDLVNQGIRPKIQPTSPQNGKVDLRGVCNNLTKDEKRGLNCRYLVVIDDVWTIRAWEAIQSVFPDNNCGSGIIVTTRIENVAKACSPSIGGQDHIHQMEALDSDASKSLFVRITFGNKGCPTEVEDVMGKILKRCAGLPLAIVSSASVLAAYTSLGSIEKWESVYRSIGSQMESHPTLEGMRQIVTLSYNHLPHELKSCMMYLSIFPEDYEIEKYRLLCRWIAEGLVMEKRGFTPMEVAESYLDELVSRNMIQIQVSFYWTEETCRVHDMLLEVMVSKSLECNFVSLIGGRAGAKKNMAGRRLHDNGIEGMNVQHVRSLNIFHQKGQQLLDLLVKFTPLMRVLDLEGCVGLTKHHLQCICRLYLLRFLSFMGTYIEEVPSQIQNLEHLQTLDVRDTSDILPPAGFREEAVST
ncbi:disease resistance protein Pik-2-like [Miscanthus floridulus]|uniref:disease resistance protein Pik-2-like n=1 Tax=Miscanthus floridulus TaxID=154761 RepID=UPI00345970D3